MERRHEALRTRIQTQYGAPVQIVDSHQACGLRVVHIEEGALAKHIEAEVGSPFDLANGPLWRAALFALGPDDHVLVLTMHHIITDGWSMAVLDREVAVLYEAWSSEPGADPTALLPELPLSYRQLALSMCDQMASEGYARQLGYWREQLAGAPTVPTLPTSRPAPVPGPVAHAGARYRFVIEQGAVARLRALARARNATMFMILMTGFAVLLAGHSGQRDIVIGTAIANRPRRDLKSMVGFFTNTLAVRIDLRDDPTASELLARVRETCLRAYENQDVPFERVISELKLARTSASNPLFQVTLGLHRQARSQTVADLRISRYDIDSCAVQFALALDFAESDSELAGVWEYSIDQFDRDDVMAWHEDLMNILTAMTAGHEPRVETLCATLADAASLRLELRSARTRDVNREKLRRRLTRSRNSADGSARNECDR
jgi:hypothetical protein